MEQRYPEQRPEPVQHALLYALAGEYEIPEQRHPGDADDSDPGALGRQSIRYSPRSCTGLGVLALAQVAGCVPGLLHGKPPETSRIAKLYKMYRD